MLLRLSLKLAPFHPQPFLFGHHFRLTWKYNALSGLSERFRFLEAGSGHLHGANEVLSIMFHTPDPFQFPLLFLYCHNGGYSIERVPVASVLLCLSFILPHSTLSYTFSLQVQSWSWAWIVSSPHISKSQLVDPSLESRLHGACAHDKWTLISIKLHSHFHFRSLWPWSIGSVFLMQIIYDNVNYYNLHTLLTVLTLNSALL